jgi:hypothetical protein
MLTLPVGLGGSTPGTHEDGDMATNKQARLRAQETRRRAAEMRKQEAAKERRRRVIIAAVVAFLVAGAGVGIYFAATAGKGGFKLDSVKTFKNLSQKHVTTKVTYKQNPPVGGEHNAQWLNCGIYDQPVPNENAVHDLEHGAVWITYKPDLAQTDVGKLKSLVQSKTKGYLTLSPYPGLPADVVASAWGKQIRLKSADDPELTKFIDKYQLGPQAPERGASCTGGFGTPSG